MKSLKVRTQIRGVEGIPDIELRAEQHFVIVEVKSEARATEDQLQRYRRLLDQSEATWKGLVLLTRYPVSLEGADAYLRWYQIAEWLEHESNQRQLKLPSRFLVDQFLGFLKARNMTMAQITQEMPNGVRSLCSLALMLYEGAVACGIGARIVGKQDLMFIYIDGKNYWAGIRYRAPEHLCFGTDGVWVDKELADALGVGGTYLWQGDNSRYGWERCLNLESEEFSFFTLSKASQMQFIERFLRENYALARKVTIATAPDSGEPEEDQFEK